MIPEQFDLIQWDFTREMEHVKQLHLFVVRDVETRYSEAVEKVAGVLDPATHDYGDVYYEAEKELQLDPAAAARHVGMMTVSRAVALTELTLAKIASEFFTDSEGVVHTHGKAWSRDEARDFFATVFATKVNVASTAMRALTQFRDQYAHGYGSFWSEEDLISLASSLMRTIPRHPPTSDELAKGLVDTNYFIGYWSRRANPSFLGRHEVHSLSIEPSPLATQRMIQILVDKVTEVLEAASGGLVDEDERATSRFVRNWQRKFEDLACTECGTVVRPARRQ
ncbi:hypothetical protein G3T36_02160 [Diaminobutyricibacter tongyongensis]|uniref:Uncharacterized protein n=1 Tax=Leifsonia tongyongensis TaxID=1268043 RepID=A0A6L9XUA2_9MICO|nr:hypothetical protein [Diaminobutyricibacter tongyongensis]NEN04664.1 hypothetical protein [Diaminobutyricibacter tongyongensis]